MQEFKSKIGNSLGTFFILTISLFGLLYLVLFLTTNFRLTQISFSGWLAIVVIYFVVSYLYAGLSNNSIFLFDNRLEVVNRLPFFRKHYTFQFDKIKSVKFRHEWTETFGRSIKPNFIRYILNEWIAQFLFPTDFKWIRISADKDYKFYCFGIEMDYYDNDGPLFEELFTKLLDKGVEVSWTDTSDIYYSQMTKNIENKKRLK